MFTSNNQYFINNLIQSVVSLHTKLHTKSIHSPYTVSGILSNPLKQKMRKHIAFASFLSWRWDSNPQPADYKSAALPIELRQQNLEFKTNIILFS
jgi:hypothetical protein